MDNNKVIKAGFTYLIGTIITRSFSLLSMPVFARILTTEDFGRVNNYTSWAAIIACVIGLGLTYSIGNAWIDFKDRIQNYIVSISILVLISSISFAVLAYCIKGFLEDIIGLPFIIILFMTVYNLFLQIENFIMMHLRFAVKSKMILIVSLSECILGFAVSLLLIYSKAFEPYVARIVGLSIPIVFIGTFLFFYTIKGINVSVNQQFWKYALKISLPMIPHGLAMIVLAQVDRVMINKLCGSYELGIYSMGYTYGSVIIILSNAAGSAYLPWQYEKLHSQSFSSIKTSQNEITWFISIAATVIMLMAPEAILVLGGEKYEESIVVVFPVLIGTIFQYLYSYYCNVENYKKKNIYIAIASIGAGILNIILNYFFISKFGYIAASYTTFVCYLLLYLFHRYLSKKIIGVELFSISSNILSVLLVIVCGIIVHFLHAPLYIRCPLAVIILLGYITLKKNTIIQIYKRFKSR